MCKNYWDVQRRLQFQSQNLQAEALDTVPFPVWIGFDSRAIGMCAQCC